MKPEIPASLSLSFIRKTNSSLCLLRNAAINITEKSTKLLKGTKFAHIFSTLVAKSLCGGFERESSGEKQPISGSNV